MSKNRIKNSSKTSYSVVVYFEGSEDVAMAVVTVHPRSADPYSMAFFRDPTVADPEELVDRAMKWAGRHGAAGIYVVEETRPVEDAFCECCGDLKHCHIGGSDNE